MSIVDDVRNLDADDVLDFLAEALDLIGALALSANGRNAADIVMAIKHIYQMVAKATQNKVTVDEVRAELAKFVDGLAENDAVADAAVDAKFDKG